jgi:hypothetical protein
MERQHGHAFYHCHIQLWGGDLDPGAPAAGAVGEDELVQGVLLWRVCRWVDMKRYVYVCGCWW